MTKMPPRSYDVQQVLTYSDILEPDIAYKLIGDSHVDYLVKLQLDDADVIMHVRDAIFNLIIWRVYHAFKIRITTDKVFERPFINSDAIINIQTKMLWDIRALYPNARSETCDALFKFVNYLYNFVVSELNAYVSSISILGLAKLINHEKVQKIVKLTYNKALGTDVVERKISEASKALGKITKDRTALSAEENCLLYYQETRQINPHQLPQVMIAYGPRTDVDDTIVLFSVMDNSIEGIKCIRSMATETLSAKKSAFYNQVAVSDSQYFGRKQHILTSAIIRIYPGDCGSRTYIKYQIKKHDYQNLLGMYMADPESEEMTELTDEILVSLIDQPIYIRSPITCKYTDGICETCGGKLMLNIDHNVNFGMLSAIHVIAPTTQKILSAKHLVKTSSQVYELSKEASKYLMRINANELHWRPEVYKKLENWSLGVSLKDMGTLHDITVLNTESVTREERFSTIRQMVLRDNKTGTSETLFMEQNDTCPFFTMQMLLHIRDYIRTNPDMTDAMLWIPLKGTEQFSVFKSLVVNDNMMKFVKAVSSFLASKIAKYTSAEYAVQDFCDIIYSKVSMAHLTHICTIIKTYMVSTEIDYRIPVVTDVHNVLFRNTHMILSRRSVGGQLAFEKLYAYLSAPDSYLVPKGGSIFDVFFDIAE